MSADGDAGSAVAFVTTHWSVVLTAQGQSAAAQEALEKLCRVNANIIYEVRPRPDRKGFALISNELPFGRLWYDRAEDAIGYAKFRSRSHDAVIHVFDEAGRFREP